MHGGAVCCVPDVKHVYSKFYAFISCGHEEESRAPTHLGHMFDSTLQRAGSNSVPHDWLLT